MNMEGFDQNNVWRLRLARYFQKALGCAELSPIYLESVQLQSLFKEFEEGVTSVCVIGVTITHALPQLTFSFYSTTSHTIFQRKLYGTGLSVTSTFTARTVCKVP